MAALVISALVVLSMAAIKIVFLAVKGISAMLCVYPYSL